MFSCEYCDIFKNPYLEGHLWTTASELYWFKVVEITEKIETYPETIIGDIFRTQWIIKDEAFFKNSFLYLTVEYFCKTLHIREHRQKTVIMLGGFCPLRGFEWIRLKRKFVTKNFFMDNTEPSSKTLWKIDTCWCKR